MIWVVVIAAIVGAYAVAQVLARSRQAQRVDAAQTPESLLALLPSSSHAWLEGCVIAAQLVESERTELAVAFTHALLGRTPSGTRLHVLIELAGSVMRVAPHEAGCEFLVRLAAAAPEPDARLFELLAARIAVPVEIKANLRRLQELSPDPKDLGEAMTQAGGLRLGPTLPRRVVIEAAVFHDDLALETAEPDWPRAVELAATAVRLGERVATLPETEQHELYALAISRAMGIAQPAGTLSRAIRVKEISGVQPAPPT